MNLMKLPSIQLNHVFTDLNSTMPSNDGLLSSNYLTYEDFFRKEYPAMVVLARMVSANSSLGEDIAQDAFRRAHENWEKIRNYDKPGAWVRRVTINLATSKKKKFVRETLLNLKRFYLK